MAKFLGPRDFPLFRQSPSGDVPGDGRRMLDYAPSPVDNPLKGLVPYAGVWKDRFPHSMEFGYLPLASLVTGYGRFDWKPLEKLLNECASRGHSVVFRVYLEYPGKSDGIPAFLVKEGVKVHSYPDPASVGGTRTPVMNHTPDYSDPRLRRVLREFIAEMGRRYDGDPRIGFLTAGLLGHWGEWHTYPREELFARPDVQTEVMDALERAFRVTPVLLRYPVGRATDTKASNANRSFGYHDDSFAWSTLDTGRREDSWYFMPSLTAAGPAALSKWKTRPIGGEIRPEAWGKVFDERPGVREIQDFRACVQQTHVSWLLDSGLFQTKADALRRGRAEAEVRRMGYEYQIASARIRRPANGRLAVSLEVKNHGVAPFYYDWPVEFGLALVSGGTGKPPTKTFRGSGKLRGLLPGTPPRQWEDTFDIRAVAPGTYRLLLRVPSPLPTGQPLRFANTAQDADLDGWLTLGETVIPQPAG